VGELRFYWRDSSIQVGVMNREDTKYAKIEEGRMKRLDDVIERFAYKIIGAAIEVHKEIGPGYLESVYQKALALEFKLQGIPYIQKYKTQIFYKGENVGEGELDFLVGDAVVVELKTVDRFAPIHQAQVISYLKSSNKSLGLLINFKVPILKEGIQRIIRTS
jgi:GxxExxY protein